MDRTGGPPARERERDRQQIGRSANTVRHFVGRRASLVSKSSNINGGGGGGGATDTPAATMQEIGNGCRIVKQLTSGRACLLENLRCTLTLALAPAIRPDKQVNSQLPIRERERVSMSGARQVVAACARAAKVEARALADQQLGLEASASGATSGRAKLEPSAEMSIYSTLEKLAKQAAHFRRARGRRQRRKHRRPDTGPATDTGGRKRARARAPSASSQLTCYSVIAYVRGLCFSKVLVACREFACSVYSGAKVRRQQRVLYHCGECKQTAARLARAARIEAPRGGITCQAAKQFDMLPSGSAAESRESRVDLGQKRQEECRHTCLCLVAARAPRPPPVKSIKLIHLTRRH